MAAWWQSISALEKVFFCIAAPATAVLIIQTIALIFGFGEQGTLDSDVSGIGDADLGSLDAADGMDALDSLDAADGADFDLPDSGDDPGLGGGLRLFSIRGLITFFTCLGWGGIAALEMGASPLLALVIAVALGSAALVLMAKMVQAFLRLQQSGNDDPRKAIGLYGEVYLSIPPKGEGAGKVSLNLGNGVKEFGAVSDTAERIPTGAQVRVIDLARDGVFVVERE